MLRLLQHWKIIIGIWKEGGTKALVYQIQNLWSVVIRYRKWVQKYDLLSDSDRLMIKERLNKLKHQPLISIVMPVYNTDRRWLVRAIESVRCQLYHNWELCIVDDCSSSPHVRETLEKYARKDPRIKVAFHQENRNISAASNSALELATGEFTALLDHDDELPEHALYMVVEEINKFPNADIIYSDEDKISARNKRYDPYFKPDWNPDLFYSFNLISHLGVYRTALMRKVGGFRQGYEGSQDYDLALRVIEQTIPEKIRHIPHVLYHWRAIPGSMAYGVSEKSYAPQAARNAIQSHLERMNICAKVVAGYRGFHRVVYPIPVKAPKVVIIISCLNEDYPENEFESKISNLAEKTTDLEFDVVVVTQNTGKHSSETSKIRPLQVSTDTTPGNRLNTAVAECDADVIVFMDGDISPVNKDWLREMVTHAIRPEIGAVGARIIDKGSTIVHGGIVVGFNGVAAFSHRGVPKTEPGFTARAQQIQNVLAVTGIALAIESSKFKKVGGFDEKNYREYLYDIDFCLRLKEAGFRNLYNPFVELLTSNISELTKMNSRDTDYFRKRWAKIIERDPYYNPNLTIYGHVMEIAFPPRTIKPWKEPCS